MLDLVLWFSGLRWISDHSFCASDHRFGFRFALSDRFRRFARSRASASRLRFAWFTHLFRLWICTSHTRFRHVYALYLVAVLRSLVFVHMDLFLDAVRLRFSSAPLHSRTRTRAHWFTSLDRSSLHTHTLCVIFQFCVRFGWFTDRGSFMFSHCFGFVYGSLFSTSLTHAHLSRSGSFASALVCTHGSSFAWIGSLSLCWVVPGSPGFCTSHFAALHVPHTHTRIAHTHFIVCSSDPPRSLPGSFTHFHTHALRTSLVTGCTWIAYSGSWILVCAWISFCTHTHTHLTTPLVRIWIWIVWITHGSLVCVFYVYTSPRTRISLPRGSHLSPAFTRLHAHSFLWITFIVFTHWIVLLPSAPLLSPLHSARSRIYAGSSPRFRIWITRFLRLWIVADLFCTFCRSPAHSSGLHLIHSRSHVLSRLHSSHSRLTHWFSLVTPHFLIVLTHWSHSRSFSFSSFADHVHALGLHGSSGSLLFAPHTSLRFTRFGSFAAHGRRVYLSS